MSKLCFEVAERISHFATIPLGGSIQHSEKPFKTAHLIPLRTTERTDFDVCEDTKISLSLVNHMWHNSVQKHLSEHLSLSSTTASFWAETFNHFLSTGALFCTLQNNISVFYHLIFSNADNLLTSTILPCTYLTSITLNVKSPIPLEYLDLFSNFVAKDTPNLDVFTISISNINDVHDYDAHLATFMSVVDRITVLDWSCTYPDPHGKFYKQLKKGVNLKRLNLSLANIGIPDKANLGGMLTNLECIQINTKEFHYGDQYDILRYWTFPLFDTLLIYGISVFQNLTLFIERHKYDIRNLFIENLPCNVKVFHSLKWVRTLLIDIDFPILEWRLARLHNNLYHRNLRTVIISNLTSDNWISLQYSLFHNPNRFPSLRYIRILSFYSTHSNLSNWPVSAFHGFVNWLYTCETNDIIILNRFGDAVDLESP